MGKRIAYVGTGAVGGYVAGHLTRAGDGRQDALTEITNMLMDHAKMNEAVKRVERGEAKPSPGLIAGW